MPGIETYGISIVLIKDMQLDAVLEHIAQAGFRYVEMSGDRPEFAAVLEKPSAVKRILDKLGLVAPVGHAPLTDIDCGSLNEEERKAAVEKTTSVFEPFAEIGLEYVVVHSNKPNRTYTSETFEKSRAQSRKSLEELADKAAAVGLKMAVENLPRRGMPRPGSTISELLGMIEGLPAHVGLCLDTGHSCCNHIEPAEEAPAAGDRLFTLHIHDSDGTSDQHWIPGRGIIDWNPFLEALERIGFAGPRILEIGSEDDDPLHLLRQCRDVAKQWESL